MANEEHLAELKKGVKHWNAWVKAQGPAFRANLREANLSEANLREADLSEADLSEANLREANLSKANLREADLSEADLSEADLFRADLRGANLKQANLNEASLWAAHLAGADFKNASLLKTRFPDAQFELRNLDVRGTDLSKAIGILKKSFFVMKGDKHTVLRKALDPPAEWLLEEPVENLAPSLPASPIAHNVDVVAGKYELGHVQADLDQITLEGLFEDLRDAVEDIKEFGNLDNQSPMLVRGVDRFLKRLPDDMDSLDQVRFGAGVQALSIQFDREKSLLEEIAPEKIGHLEAALMRANLIAQHLPIWIEFRKDEAETEPVFEARQEDIEAILEHAAEALESDPEHFDPSLFKRIREYLDDATMVGYLASKDLLLNIAHTTFSLASDLAKDTLDAQRKQVVKNIATALNVQLGAILLDLAGILPKQLRWLVEWLEYLPKLLT